MNSYLFVFFFLLVFVLSILGCYAIGAGVIYVIPDAINWAPIFNLNDVSQVYPYGFPQNPSMLTTILGMYLSIQLPFVVYMTFQALKCRQRRYMMLPLFALYLVSYFVHPIISLILIAVGAQRIVADFERPQNSTTTKTMA